KDGAYEVFEGLFDDPPTILVNGYPKKLSPSHKIIIAGNANYAIDRHQHEFFAKYCEQLQFKEFTDKFLKECIVIPVVSAMNPDLHHEKILALAQIVLTKLNLVKKMGQTVTPRGVGNIAL